MTKAALKETKALVRSLMGPYLGERMEAQVRLKELGPQAVDGLLALIHREQRKLRIRRRIFYGIAGSFALLGLPLAAYLVYLGIATGNSGLIGGGLGGILGGWGGGGVGGSVGLMFPSQLQIAALSALAHVEDERAAGPLAEVVVSRVNPSRDSRVAAAMTLIRLLPRIEQEQYDLLTTYQRTCLYRLLREPHVSKETELVLAVLSTIERVGDTRALLAVNRLAEIPVPFETAAGFENQARCATAALRGRDVLLACQANASHAEALVRASQAPADESGTLLRAVRTSAETPEAVLLRASQEDSGAT